MDLLRLAESLGAETVTLDGPSAAAALIEYAQTRNATRLIVGAPKRRGWRAWLRPSTATELVRRARGFDVSYGCGIDPLLGGPARVSAAASAHSTATHSMAALRMGPGDHCRVFRDRLADGAVLRARQCGDGVSARRDGGGLETRTWALGTDSRVEHRGTGSLFSSRRASDSKSPMSSTWLPSW